MQFAARSAGATEKELCPVKASELTLANRVVDGETKVF